MKKTLIIGIAVLLLGSLAVAHTPQDNQSRIPDAFYAYDGTGNWMTAIINNQGEVSSVHGSVGSIQDLEQDSFFGCEYFMNLEMLADLEDPSKHQCYGWDEVQQRIESGQMSYLQQTNATQENESTNQSAMNTTNQTMNQTMEEMINETMNETENQTANETENETNTS